jgi:hypothetical protein
MYGAVTAMLRSVAALKTPASAVRPLFWYSLERRQRARDVLDRQSVAIAECGREETLIYRHLAKPIDQHIAWLPQSELRDGHRTSGPVPDL